MLVSASTAAADPLDLRSCTESTRARDVNVFGSARPRHA